MEGVINQPVMADKSERSTQRSVTISEMADSDLGAVAEWKGIPYGTYLRMIIEAHHENPGTQALIRRAKEELKLKHRK